MVKSVAVLGLGRFGRKLALSLYESGADVMVVDQDEELIEQMAEKVNYAICADLENPEAIKSLGLEEMDIVIVATASELTSSIMSVMVAKELGVKKVVAKAYDERMGTILKKIGADEIIIPEEESGLRTARRLLSDSFLEFFDIDKNLCLVEMKPKPEWVGKNLVELNLRGRYHINVVAVRDESEMRSFIDPERPLDEDSELLVILEKKDLKKIM